MADLVTYRAEMSALVKKFQSYGNDSMAYSRDHFEKNKREECCELQGGRLNFFESVKPDHNTTTTVVEVEKRRGTNILILRCGPGGRTVIFLEFDSKRLTDEWQEALCRYTGQTHVPNPALRRVRSELPGVMRRKRMARTRSAFPDSDYFEQQVDSDSEQEIPPSPPVATPSPPGSPIELERVPGFNSATSENYSRPRSLHSFDTAASPRLADLAKYSVEEKCTLSDLHQLKVKDIGDDVIVKDAIPLRQLHVGDEIMMTNGLPMNAREMSEHIRTSPEQTIVLTIKRGAVCTAREEEHELIINFKGSQSVRLDTVDAIFRACTSCCSLHYAEMPEKSRLTITEINNIPVTIGSQPDQIAKNMREALDTSNGGLTLRLVPQSLLDALAEEDDATHEKQAHDTADE